MVRSSPQVSVIMPARNCEAYVAEAVQSILNQTFSDSELLIADDASTDGTLDILQGFTDPRITLIGHEAPAGSAATRNELFARARGEYIALMDADDISLPERLEKQLHYLDATGHDAVGCANSFLSPDGTLRPAARFPAAPAEVRQLLLTGAAICHPSLVARASLAGALGGYRARVGLAYDLDLLIRLSEQGSIGNVAHCLYIYRQQPGSLSATRLQEQTNSATLARMLAVERRLYGTDSLHLFSDDNLDAIMNGAFILPPGHTAEEQRRILLTLIKQVLRRHPWCGPQARQALRALRTTGSTGPGVLLLAASLAVSPCTLVPARARTRYWAGRLLRRLRKALPGGARGETAHD